MKYEAVIGLEVHAQLLTRSKMFCSCSAEYQDAPPNTHVCPVCLGMPGVLPVINHQAINATVMTGLALHCSINPRSKFDRKNYPYPDLMKGYQISQYDQPICVNGWLAIEAEGGTKRAGITRVHLEEDTAKLSHRASEGETYSLVDVNRAGTPLMEIVGEPDLRTPEEARQYLVKLRRTLQYLGVSTGNMEEGSFRCDANVSLRPVGSAQFGTRAEVKNMNSFRSVFRALEFEIERQAHLLDSGQRIVQETRGWVETRSETVSQRSKEQAHDYRYFPEPDLPPLTFSVDFIEAVRAHLPELPDARKERFIAHFGLTAYEAELLTSTRAMAEFFEAVATAALAKTSGIGQADLWQRAKAVSHWCTGELNRLLNLHDLEVEQLRVTPQALVELLDLIDGGKINQTSAKEVFEEMFRTGRHPGEIVQERGLIQINSSDELEGLVARILAGNGQAVADYHAGKAPALGFLVGQIMKESRGRANPGTVTTLLKTRLDS